MAIGSRRLALVGVTLWWLATSANGEYAVESSEQRADRTDLAQVVAPSVGPQASDSAPRSSRTVLGDLSGFRALAVDTLRIAQTGDLGAARERVKELESSWEHAEPKMKPLAPDKWQAVDAAIDRARRELRFWRARRTDSVDALQALINTIDSIK